MNLDCSMAWRWSGKTYMGRSGGGQRDGGGDSTWIAKLSFRCYLKQKAPSVPSVWVTLVVVWFDSFWYALSTHIPLFFPLRVFCLPFFFPSYSGMWGRVGLDQVISMSPFQLWQFDFFSYPLPRRTLNGLMSLAMIYVDFSTLPSCVPSTIIFPFCPWTLKGCWVEVGTWAGSSWFTK